MIADVNHLSATGGWDMETARSEAVSKTAAAGQTTTTERLSSRHSKRVVYDSNAPVGNATLPVSEGTEVHSILCKTLMVVQRNWKGPLPFMRQAQQFIIDMITLAFNGQINWPSQPGDRCGDSRR